MKLPRGSRLLAWFTISIGAVLSAYLKDSTYFAIAVPSATGLYVNKQFQERKKDEQLNK